MGIIAGALVQVTAEVCNPLKKGPATLTALDGGQRVCERQ